MTKLVKSILSDNLQKKHTRVKKNINYNEYFKAPLLFKNKDGKNYMKFNVSLINKTGISSVTLTLITEATGIYYHQHSLYV